VILLVVPVAWYSTVRFLPVQAWLARRKMRGAFRPLGSTAAAGPFGFPPENGYSY